MAARYAQKEPIDLSILERSENLVPYMTVAQEIEFLQLETAIESAQSNLRSGQILATTKPSGLNPNRDINPVIERGEEMIARAQQVIEAKQSELVTFLTNIEAQITQQEILDKQKFDYTLESATYANSLRTQSQRLLEACSDLGYKTLFFDGIFIQDSTGTHRAESELRNQIYDILIKIDGTNFTVTVPMDFQLKADTLGKSSQIFSYENTAVFKNDKKALLAIELIAPKGSQAGLLSLRAIDLATQVIATQQLIKVTNLAEIVGFESEEWEDSIPDQIKLSGQANTFEILSNLEQPYTFEVLEATTEPAASEEEEAAETNVNIVAPLLTHTLLQQTDLQITDGDFILRAYGKALETPETWQGQANARLTLTEVGDSGSSYQLSVQADGSERVLPGGILTLSSQEPTDIE